MAFQYLRFIVSRRARMRPAKTAQNHLSMELNVFLIREMVDLSADDR
jgi:hypothetical protein